jgi:hypothetical protein
VILPSLVFPVKYRQLKWRGEYTREGERESKRYGLRELEVECSPQGLALSLPTY